MMPRTLECILLESINIYKCVYTSRADIANRGVALPWFLQHHVLGKYIGFAAAFHKHICVIARCNDKATPSTNRPHVFNPPFLGILYCAMEQKNFITSNAI